MDKGMAVLRESCVKLFSILDIAASTEQLQRPITTTKTNYTTIGSGAGKGGGGGGSVREAGGKLGEMGAAREEEYFRRQNALLIEKLRTHTKKSIQHHQELIKKYTEALEHTQSKLEALKKEESADPQLLRNLKHLQDIIESHKKALVHAKEMAESIKKEDS